MLLRCVRQVNVIVCIEPFVGVGNYVAVVSNMVVVGNRLLL